MVLDDLKNKVSLQKISGKFHNTIVQATCKIVMKISEKEKIKTICLSGGCFMNAILLKKMMIKLKHMGLDCYIHNILPPNDECISYGQTVIAGMRNLSVQNPG